MWTTSKISILNNTTTTMTKLLVLNVFILIGFPHLFNPTNIEMFISGLIVSSYVFGIMLYASKSSNRVLVETASYFNSVIGNKTAEVNYYIPDGIEREGEESKRIYKFKWK